MEKFCVYCGKPLQEGQTCDCQKEAQANSQQQGVEEAEKQAETQAQPVSEIQAETADAVQKPEQLEAKSEAVQLNTGSAYDGTLPEGESTQPPVQQTHQAVQIRPQSYVIPRKNNGTFANFVKRCWVILTQFFAHPVQIMHIAAEKKDYTAGLVFWVLNALLAGLVPAIMIPRLLENMMGSALLRILDIPAGWLFVEGMLVGLVWTASISMIALLAAKIMGSRASFKSVVGAVGVSCIGMAAVYLVVCLVSLVAPSMGLGVYIFLQMIGIVLLFVALTQSLEISQNRVVYCLFIALVVWAVLTALYCSLLVADIAGIVRGVAQNGLGGLLR